MFDPSDGWRVADAGIGIGSVSCRYADDLGTVG
jgi:hypothetical protein